MHFRCKEEGKKSGLKFALEESPAESAARRLAKIDLRRFPQAAKVVRGNIADDEMYYTNSIHLRADAPVDLITRIRQPEQVPPDHRVGRDHPRVRRRGAPSTASVLALVRKTFEKTQAAQLTDLARVHRLQRLPPRLREPRRALRVLRLDQRQRHHAHRRLLQPREQLEQEQARRIEGPPSRQLPHRRDSRRSRRARANRPPWKPSPRRADVDGRHGPGDSYASGYYVALSSCGVESMAAFA